MHAHEAISPVGPAGDPDLTPTEQSLIEWLQQLVRFPSEQTDLQEKDPQIARFVRDCAVPILQGTGTSFRFDDMGNAIAEIGPACGPSLLFVAYAMTHPGAKMIDPFSATIEIGSGKRAIRGRGVAEQKSALAALCGALAKLAKGRPLERRLSVVLLTAGETGRHDAIANVLPRLELKPDFAIVCIGTNNRVAIGNKGRIDFDVVVHGKSSHSSAPWLGVNAITGAQKLLLALETLALDVPRHPHFGAATLTATAIDSLPRATHTVPDTVRITYDRRLLPGEDPDRAYRTMSEIVALPEPWKVECQLGPVMYPNELSTESRLAVILKSAFEAAGRPHPDVFYCSFALDAGYLAREGIQAVMLGPGDVEQFHSSEESVSVSDLVVMSNVYYRIIEQCLGHNP
jgi:acetylornithine deacetylase